MSEIDHNHEHEFGTVKIDRSEWAKIGLALVAHAVTVVVILAFMRSDISYNRRDIDQIRAEQQRLQSQISELTQTLNTNLTRIASDVGEIKGRFSRE